MRDSKESKIIVGREGKGEKDSVYLSSLTRQQVQMMSM